MRSRSWGRQTGGIAPRGSGADAPQRITFAAVSPPVEVNVTERSAEMDSVPEVESVLLERRPDGQVPGLQGQCARVLRQ